MFEANQHLTMVGGFGHLQDPRNLVVRTLMPLGGSPKISQSWGPGQIKPGSE